MLTLLHGDCREILKTLPDQSVQCCTVLDPFGGSGTTGQVAIENSRKAILIELNSNYLPMIEKRTMVVGLPM